MFLVLMIHTSIKYFVYLIIFPLHFILNSLDCYVFKCTNLFFYNIESSILHLHWPFHGHCNFSFLKVQFVFFYIFYVSNVLCIWNKVLITNVMSLSANSNTHVSSVLFPLISFSSLWVIYSFFFVWLLIFCWVTDIVKFILSLILSTLEPRPFEHSPACLRACRVLVWQVTKRLRSSSGCSLPGLG